MIWIAIIIFICIVDQLSKYLVVHNIAVGTSDAVINGFFYLSHIKNRGVAMGMLQDSRIVIVPVTLIIAVVVGYFLYKSKNRFLSLALAFIIGGAVGNLIDRIFVGSVTDFFELRFKSYSFYVFNVADAFVVVGTILLAIYMLIIYKEKEKRAV